MTEHAPAGAAGPPSDVDDSGLPPVGVYRVPPALPPTTFVAASLERRRQVSRTAKLVVAVSATVVVIGGAALVDPDAPTARPRSAADATAAPAVVAPAPAGAAYAPAAPAPASDDEAIAAEPPRGALALLGAIAVKGRAPRTGYARSQFGPAWADTDRNGCDTRNDILARDLTGESFRPGTRDCVVVAGTLAEPYTGRIVSFTKADADAVQIDHVVSLSNAWQTGAFAWPAGKRLAFANDPLNLLAVDGRANQAKSDGDAATWLPPNPAYRCAMVARQTAVKVKYQLWVTPPERDAIARVLRGCPDQPAPTGGNPTVAPVAAADPARTTATSPPRAMPAPPAGVRDYANCDEMHRDYPGGVARPGAVDQRRGGGSARYRPHYSQELYDANAESDRDRDGIACEQ